jgi:TonB family protein
MRKPVIATLLGILAFAPVIKAQQSTPPVQSSVQNPDAPRRVGGGVLPPVLKKSVDPKYPCTDTGRPRSGSSVLVSLIVDRKGRPTEIHIVRSGGDDFDKSAFDAVSQYRFKPATENGQPVPVKINVDVNFQGVDKQRSEDEP